MPWRRRLGGLWRKGGRASPRQSFTVFPGRHAPDQHQIFGSPLYGTRRLGALIIKEPHYVRPLLPACLLGPQVYVTEYPAPALYLPFQLGLKSVTLAQDEAIDYQITQKGEPFRGHDVSLNSLSDLIAKLATSPGLYVRCSLGVSKG